MKLLDFEDKSDEEAKNLLSDFINFKFAGFSIKGQV